MVSAPAWGRTCVYCMYYGMLRKERAVWSAGALWCRIQVCETVCVCVFSMLEAGVRSSSQGNAGSRRPREGMVITTQTLIEWDVQ